MAVDGDDDWDAPATEAPFAQLESAFPVLSQAEQVVLLGQLFDSVLLLSHDRARLDAVVAMTESLLAALPASVLETPVQVLLDHVTMANIHCWPALATLLLGALLRSHRAVQRNAVKQLVIAVNALPRDVTSPQLQSAQSIAALLERLLCWPHTALPLSDSAQPLGQAPLLHWTIKPLAEGLRQRRMAVTRLLYPSGAPQCPTFAPHRCARVNTSATRRRVGLEGRLLPYFARPHELQIFEMYRLLEPLRAELVRLSLSVSLSL